MKLFYTVTSSEGKEQADPSLSLGGFCSSSNVPNNSASSLFSDLSLYSFQESMTEYIGLILKNTFDREVYNISIWIPKKEENYCKFRIAVVELTSSGEMETIPNKESRPLYAEFYETSENDKFELPDFVLKPGGMIGLWLERGFNEDSEEFLMRNNCDYIYEKGNQGVEKIEENSLKISFEYA